MKQQSIDQLLKDAVPADTVIKGIMPKGDSYTLPKHLHEKLTSLDMLKESPSSIRVFLTCPLKWYLERYAGIEAGDSDVEEYNRWGVMGTFVHRVLEVFYNEPEDNRTQKVLGKIFDFCLNEVENGGSSGAIDTDLSKGYQYVLEKDPWLKRAPHKFGPFPEWFEEEAEKCVFNIFQFDIDPREIKIIGNESWVSIKKNDILVRGKIDRVTLNSTNGLLIDDYKTGKDPDDSQPIEVTSDAYIAMGLYALMYQNDQYPRTAAVRLLHLKTESKYVLKMTQRRIQLSTELLHQVTQSMSDTRLTGKIMASPTSLSNKGHCGFCPASGFCPAYEDGSFEPIVENLKLKPLDGTLDA